MFHSIPSISCSFGIERSVDLAFEKKHSSVIIRQISFLVDAIDFDFIKPRDSIDLPLVLPRKEQWITDTVQGICEQKSYSGENENRYLQN